VGVEVARQAGAYLMAHFRTDLKISHKGVIDLVTEVDIATEKLIVSRLAQEFPDYSVLAEENHADSAQAECRWIIDPLDGTTNYAHGFPFFAVSIGLEYQGEIVFGVVYCPVWEEMFSAIRGKGAFCNGVPIRVSLTDSLSQSFLATGFPYDIRTSADNNLDNFHNFALKTLAIRRAGAAALDLSYVAAGRFDGFWELKLNPWDCGPGYLLVREAGGMVTNFRGEPGSIYEKKCLATNGRIHEEMLALLRES
jgi:myo-inositol-1(or 4)-monophosphatase